MTKTIHALHIDFLSSVMQYRHARIGRHSELIAKAVGIKSNYRPLVIDATAGLGGDAFVLACLGCRVLMLERSPVIASALQDAIKRLLADDRFKHLSFKLIHADAADYLQRLDTNNFPDVVYLDPMYPEQKKSALPKKELRLLREIVGDDLDADKLLDIALAVAQKRVVVKRHRHAPFLADKKPSFVVKGRSQRFDVYVPLQKPSP